MTNLYLMKNKEDEEILVREEHVKHLSEYDGFVLLKKESVGVLFDFEFNPNNHVNYYKD